MNKVLFIGNGLNRTINKSISWNDLLNFIEEFNNIDNNEEIPFPLKFEILVNLYSKNKKIENEFYNYCKQKIGEKIENIEEIELEMLNVINLKKYKAIITTNYDCNIEKYLNISTDLHINWNTKYLNKYLFNIDNKLYIYHPHGCFKYPKTICLGYEHYCGIIEKCRTEIKTNENGFSYIYNLLVEKNINEINWYDYFFTSNISYRSSSIATNREKLRDKINNKIIYYDILKKNENKEQFYNILKGM